MIVIISLYRLVRSMHNQQSHSTLKVLDFRNARYQGQLHSKASKMHGIGVVLDDEMNFYCSEWCQGQLNGRSIIILNSGHYLYGEWKEGQPNGIIVFFNKKFTIYANFVKGKATQKAIGVDESSCKLSLFNGQDISRPYQQQFALISCEPLICEQKLEDSLTNLASKNGLAIAREEVNIKSYMANLSRKYADILVFNDSHNHSYFGFHNGLGIKFNIRKASGQLLLSSIGHHTNYKLSQIGAKYYELQCTEEGNFQTKQIISYNKYSKRPAEKCRVIYQNLHRKSLNFINGYFELKNSLLSDINTFLDKKFIKEYMTFDKKPQAKSISPKKVNNGLIPAERQNFYKEAKEDYLKRADDNRNKSQSKLSISPNKFNISYSKMISEKSQGQAKKNDIRMIRKNKQPKKQSPINRLDSECSKEGHIKKQKQQGKSKSKPKTLSGKIIKSPQKYQDAEQQRSSKEIRYLKGYEGNKETKMSRSHIKHQEVPQNKKNQVTDVEGADNISVEGPAIKYKVTKPPPEKQLSKSPSRQCCQKNTKAIAPSLNNPRGRREMQEMKMEKRQEKNELKIRQQLEQQQIKKESLFQLLKNQSQIEDILEIMNNPPRQHAINRQERKTLDLIEGSQINNFKYIPKATGIKHHLTNTTPQYFKPEPQRQPQRQPLRQPQRSEVHSSHYYYLQQKRAKLLRDFQQLNSQQSLDSHTTQSYFPILNNIYLQEGQGRQQRSLYTQIQSSRQQIIESEANARRLQQEAFNRKYRNYIQSQQQESPQNNQIQQWIHYEEPTVSNFSPVKIDDRSRKKPKYEYYFE